MDLAMQLMAAAVDLQELALAGHPLAPAAVARGTTGPGRSDRGLGEDSPEGPPGDVQVLALGQQLGQMAVVDPGIGRRGELDHPVADGVGDAVARDPVAVAVDEARRPVGPIAAEQPADLTDRQAQDQGRILGRQATGQDMVEDV